MKGREKGGEGWEGGKPTKRPVVSSWVNKNAHSSRSEAKSKAENKLFHSLSHLAFASSLFKEAATGCRGRGAARCARLLCLSKCLRLAAQVALLGLRASRGGARTAGRRSRGPRTRRTRATKSPTASCRFSPSQAANTSRKTRKQRQSRRSPVAVRPRMIDNTMTTGVASKDT